MTQNYEVLVDELETEAFVKWLPELKPHETMYVCLMARNKYVRENGGVPHIKSDKYQCKRFTVNKESLISKLKQLECPLGSYRTKDVIVPQEALAAYICVNPRDQVKGSVAALKQFADLVASGSTTHNVHQEAMTSLHKSPGTKHFVDFDFDFTDGAEMRRVLQGIKECVNEEAVSILVTRGGFHALVQVAKVSPQFAKTWYAKILSLPGADIVGDNMIPIPGTYQGGAVPRLYRTIDDCLKVF